MTDSSENDTEQDELSGDIVSAKQHERHFQFLKPIKKWITDFRVIEIIGKGLILIAVAFQLTAIEALNNQITTYPKVMEQLQKEAEGKRKLIGSQISEMNALSNKVEKLRTLPDQSSRLHSELNVINNEIKDLIAEIQAGTALKSESENDLRRLHDKFTAKLIKLNEVMAEAKGLKNEAENFSENIQKTISQSDELKAKIMRERIETHNAEKYLPLGKRGFIIMFLLGSILTLTARIMEFRKKTI